MRTSATILLACVFSMCAQAKKTIFMITDAEGVSGICRQDQTDPKDPELRALLTGEINAAVDGFFEGGADEVIVWDGHDGSATLSVATIHPRAKLVIGSIGANYSFDRHYTALAFIGQHSMAGVRAGIMAHSYSSLGIQNMRLNGKPIGEIGTVSALAGAFDIPVILLTGDQAAADEMRAIVPETETAVVKEGLQRYACISLSAPSARDLIRASARRAMTKIGQIRPYKIAGPATIEIEHTTRSSLGVDAGRVPGATQIDDRTIRYSGKDFLEAWMRYRVH
jgi:D-amino peptidase